MQDPKGLWHRRAAPSFDLALAVAATTGVTAVVLWISAERGRLSMPPKFDDVSYMIDALRRLHELQRGGIASLVHDLISRPPHSPYSTAAALLGYLTFGLHDYAPYVVNAVVLLIFFRFVLHLCRGMAPLLRTCVVAGVLPIPLVSLAINEFRPDFFSAELVMIGAMLLVAEPLVGAGPRRHLLIGAAFAGAILAKPTAFPATLAVFFLSGFLAAATHLTFERPRRTVELVRAGTVALSAFLFIAGPYLVLHAQKTLGYVRFHLAGPGSAMWPHVTRGEMLHEHLDGASGEVMLGAYAYPLLAVVALFGAAAAFRTSPVERARAFSVHAVLLAAYAITALAPKHLFFGLPFQVMLVFTAVFAARRLVVGGEPGPAHPRAASAVVAAAAAVSLATCRLPRDIHHASADHIQQVCSFHGQVYDGVVALLPDTRCPVLLTFTGEVSAANLWHRALKDGRDNQFIEWILATKPADYNRWLQTTAVVVAIQHGTPWSNSQYPSDKILDETIAALDRDPRFTRAGKLRVPESDRMVIFYKRK